MAQLYGRKLRLTIMLDPNRTNAFSEDDTARVHVLPGNAPTIPAIVIEQDGTGSDGIRVTFDVNYPGFKAWYYSEINIYNFNEDTLMRVIKDGAAVILEAGYSGANFGVIFDGYIFQSTFERENATDYKLTLRCIDGDKMFRGNFTAFQLDKGRNNQVGQYNAIAAYSQKAIPIGSEQSQLRSEKQPRGCVVFTTPQSAMNKILKMYTPELPSGYQLFSNKGKLELVDLKDPLDPNIIVVSPEGGKGGLIGTPVQTQYGANFTVLLNANIKICKPIKQVQLEMSQLRALKAEHGTPLSVLDENQTYQVIGVRHLGDTRGQEWYTQVTGINKSGATALITALQMQQGGAKK